MPKSTVFAINTPDVVAEVIDQELVAIHLGSGCYYHANVTGSQIWELLTAGLTQAGAAIVLAEEYQQPVSKVQADVMAFCQKLVQEELIKVMATSSESNQVTPLIVKTQKYQKPTLKKHEDMRELLLLDPIHDVGEDMLPLTKV